MELPTNISTYTQWSGILTLVCLVITIIGFILKWGFRFRLVGVTGFLSVLTVGIFALGLGLSPHPKILGAIRYSLVYDNGANQTVIAVSPQATKSDIEATLRQAASDLFSSGRNSIGSDRQLTIRARTLLHPQPGITKPVYLGQVKRSLKVRNDEQMQVEVFSENFAQLPKRVKG